MLEDYSSLLYPLALISDLCYDFTNAYENEKGKSNESNPDP